MAPSNLSHHVTMRIDLGNGVRSARYQRRVFRAMRLIDCTTANRLSELGTHRGNATAQIIASSGRDSLGYTSAESLLHLLSSKQRADFFRYFQFPEGFADLERHHKVKSGYLSMLWGKAVRSIAASSFYDEREYLVWMARFYRKMNVLSDRAHVKRDGEPYSSAFEELINVYIQTGDMFVLATIARHLFPYFFHEARTIVSNFGAGNPPNGSFNTMVRDSLISSLAELRRTRAGIEMSFLNALGYLCSTFSDLVSTGMHTESEIPDGSLHHIGGRRISISDELLHAAVNRLVNRRFQAVIRLHYFEGLSFEEIGKRVGGLSADAVIKAHDLAIAELKQQLDPEE